VAGRAYWRGYLKLSLVSCPIALFEATVTGNEVEPADTIEGGLVESEQEAHVMHGVIEIDECVGKEEISERFLDRHYYILPDGEIGQQAFAVIREAVRQQAVVGIGKVVFKSGVHIIALEAHGQGMMGTTLHLPYDIPFNAISDEKVSKDMLDLASHMVQTKTARFEPERLAGQLAPKDRRAERLEANGGLNAVPASDRVVSLDHNSPKYIEAVDALAALEQALKETNQYEDPQEKEQHVAEVSAARRLLQSTKVRVMAVSAVLTPVLVAITKRFFDTGLGKIAGKVVDTLWPLLGLIF
jgi:DNA end-binding protein Ku